MHTQLPKPFRLPIIAVAEWVMVLPATVLLAAAALRLLQPPQYEPARASSIIFNWTMTHISHLGAAILFIGMPGLVVIGGCSTLLLIWRVDQTLRQDAARVFTILWRHRVIVLLIAAALLAGAILTFAVVHIVTD